MTELTQLIAGASPGVFDAEVLVSLIKAWQKPDDPISTWLVAVKNDDGHIYRTATLKSLEQLLDFLEDMERLGMVDELEDALEQVDGFDAVLGMPVRGKR